MSRKLYEYHYHYHLGSLRFPWEVWLKSAVWAGAFSALAFGGRGVVPKLGSADYLWVSFGLLAPMLGLLGAWGLHQRRGRVRYACLWVRFGADVALLFTIILYLVTTELTGDGGGGGILNTGILAFCAWFAGILIHRDVLFLIAIEQLAKDVEDGHQHGKSFSVVEIANKIDRWKPTEKGIFSDRG